MSNTTLDILEGLSRKLTIEIPETKVTEELNSAYVTLQKSVTLPGFRKGKAPIAKIKPLYKDKVQEDVFNRLISETYRQALDEHKQDPISHPTVNFEPFKEGHSFNFTAQFEIKPEVSLKTYEGLKVQKEIFKVDDSQVDEVLTNIQKSKPETTPVLEARAAQLDDLAKIDFDGFVDGAPLEGGSAKDFEIQLGTNSFIPGFEEGLVGMNINDEKELNLKFPDEYHAPDIAGKDVIFKVKLHALLKKTFPEINDAFATTVNEEFKTLDDLKSRIKEDIEEGEKKRIEDDLKNRILRALVKANPVDVPLSLREEQKQKLIEDTQNRLKNQGMNEEQFEEYKQKWDSDFNETSSFMIQSSFLIDALAKKLDLKASAEDVDKKLVEYAAQSGMPIEQLEEFYKTPERRSQMSFQITEDRAIEHLIKTAKIETVEKDKLKEDK